MLLINFWRFSLLSYLVSFRSTFDWLIQLNLKNESKKHLNSFVSKWLVWWNFAIFHVRDVQELKIKQFNNKYMKKMIGTASFWKKFWVIQGSLINTNNRKFIVFGIFSRYFSLIWIIAVSQISLNDVLYMKFVKMWSTFFKKNYAVVEKCRVVSGTGPTLLPLQENWSNFSRCGL